VTGEEPSGRRPPEGPVTDTVEPVLDPRLRRRQQRAWYVYDWANSAYITTVVTVFLGPYLTSVTEEAAGADGFVHPLGVPVRAGSYFPYLVSLSVALSVVLMPLVGAIADRTQRKRELLGLFAYIGALATMGLYFVRGSAYLAGGLLFVVANVAYSISIVVYNSFLPDIATPEERDDVSSRGWGVGYLGGFLLLATNLALFTARDSLGLSEGDAARISVLSAGVWWALFTVVPLLGLRSRRTVPPIAPGTSVLVAGFRQLAITLREVRALPLTLFFLVAYVFYNDGIQTVIALAAVYGDEELRLGSQTLIVAILMVQFVAFVGALALGRLARVIGPKRTVLGSLVAWTVTVTIGYFVPAREPVLFFLLAALIGFVLGGSQALSRSLFSQLIPQGKEAEYFSLYEISDRGTSWFGPLLFGIVYQTTGSYRAAIISLVVFFVGGFFLLLKVPMREAIVAAGNTPPDKV
jgi:MFS transporter, UMF1 family